MSARCEAITATFAWFVNTCGEPAVGTVEVDGDDYAACAEHGAA